MRTVKSTLIVETSEEKPEEEKGRGGGECERRSHLCPTSQSPKEAKSEEIHQCMSKQTHLEIVETCSCPQIEEGLSL